MARLIVKSPYIKCGGGQGAGGYMKYIATRERVEIVPDDRPPTRKQEQLITKLVKDFPDTKDLLEYEDYAQHPTKANASSLITLALEENWSQVQSSEGYAKYIATRPRAERLGDHGLFGDEDGVELDKAMLELEHYTGNVWTHIISLHRKDAARLGYAQTFLGQMYRDGGLLIPDAEKARHWLKQAAERELHQAQYALGKLLPSDDPNVHDPSDGIRWLNAAAQNGNDYAAYALGKEHLRGEHVLKNADRAAEYFRQAAEAQNPWAQYLLGKLHLMGEGVGQDQNIAYGWFRAAAMQGHTYAQFFKERMEQGPPGPPCLPLSVIQLLHHMGNIFRDNVPEDSTSMGLHIDHKRLQALQEKRIALGHKPDDHVETQNMGGMTMG